MFVMVTKDGKCHRTSNDDPMRDMGGYFPRCQKANKKKLRTRMVKGKWNTGRNSYSYSYRSDGRERYRATNYPALTNAPSVMHFQRIINCENPWLLGAGEVDDATKAFYVLRKGKVMGKPLPPDDIIVKSTPCEGCWPELMTTEVKCGECGHVRRVSNDLAS